MSKKEARSQEAGRAVLGSSLSLQQVHSSRSASFQYPSFRFSLLFLSSRGRGDAINGSVTFFFSSGPILFPVSFLSSSFETFRPPIDPFSSANLVRFHYPFTSSSTLSYSSSPPTAPSPKSTRPTDHTSLSSSSSSLLNPSPPLTPPSASLLSLA